MRISVIRSACCRRLRACAKPETDAQLAARAGAPLFKGMGDYHRVIDTKDPGAQRYFDQGMMLAFGFNHAEAIRSFRAAQKLDPDCAMCFWGEALATGPNINVTAKGKAIMSPDGPGSGIRGAGQGARPSRRASRRSSAT